MIPECSFLFFERIPLIRRHLSSISIRELETIEAGTGERYIPKTSNIYFASHDSSVMDT